MLEDKELVSIIGGTDSSFINAFVRLAQIVIDVGKMLGSSLRSIFSRKKYC